MRDSLVRIRALVTALVLGLAMLIAAPVHGGDRPVVVATFTILGDFVRQVAGDEVDLRVLTPAGAEVHEYELRPRDFMALEKADLVFYNGYTLEQWMPQLRTAVGDGVPVVSLGEKSGVDVLPIVTGEYEGEPDPHLWMDPARVKAMVGVIAESLAERFPDQAETFEANGRAYQEQLADLDAELREMLERIPEEQRTLITSEAAFLYFADAFGFHHDGIWGTNAESEGTSRQIMRIIDVIKEREPAAIFWESTISSRYVEGVSDDVGVPYAGPLYVDSLGEKGSGAETYVEMMRRNAELLTETLVDG